MFYPADTRKGPLEKTNREGKASIAVDDNLMLFNGNLAHRVKDFQGERCTVVFFTNRGWSSISSYHARAAKKLGICLPSSKTMARCEQFLQSAGKLASKVWSQPQNFGPSRSSEKHIESKMVAPVPENSSNVDEKLDAGVEELGRALDFSQGPASPLTTTPAQRQKGGGTCIPPTMK